MCLHLPRVTSAPSSSIISHSPKHFPFQSYIRLCIICIWIMFMYMWILWVYIIWRNVRALVVLWIMLDKLTIQSSSKGYTPAMLPAKGSIWRKCVWRLIAREIYVRNIIVIIGYSKARAPARLNQFMDNIYIYVISIKVWILELNELLEEKKFFINIFCSWNNIWKKYLCTKFFFTLRHGFILIIIFDMWYIFWYYPSDLNIWSELI